MFSLAFYALSVDDNGEFKGSEGERWEYDRHRLLQPLDTVQKEIN